MPIATPKNGKMWPVEKLLPWAALAAGLAYAVRQLRRRGKAKPKDA